jgi:hypothetical protein
MSVYHDEIEIEDMEYCEEEDLYTYPCPCGDEFIITKVKFVIFIIIVPRGATMYFSAYVLHYLLSYMLCFIYF